jgi:hypothetical protein
MNEIERHTIFCLAEVLGSGILDLPSVHDSFIAFLTTSFWLTELCVEMDNGIASPWKSPPLKYRKKNCLKRPSLL